jgi:hypothetical protein
MDLRRIAEKPVGIAAGPVGGKLLHSLWRRTDRRSEGPRSRTRPDPGALRLWPPPCTGGAVRRDARRRQRVLARAGKPAERPE